MSYYYLTTPEGSPIIEVDNNQATIRGKLTTEDVISFFNTYYYWDMKDAGCGEIFSINEAINQFRKDGFLITIVND